MLIHDTHGSSTSPPEPADVDRAGGRRISPYVVWGGIAAAVLVLVAGQLIAVHINALGPLTSLFRDYAGTPKSATTPWAGFLLALIGVTTRVRVSALAAAVAIDLVFVAIRAFDGRPFTVGNGPTIVLTALAVIAWMRWSGARRETALRTIALGALLILATKVGEIWLDITAWACPQVLDPYVEVADRALGNPSWLVGQALELAGPIPTGVVRWVYFELPVAAIVVAVWQLRGVTTGVWPQHHLVRTFLAIGLIGPIFYVIFPVVGPVLAYGPQGHGMEIADVWPNIIPALPISIESMPFDGITPRNCMPSLHTAWALALFIHSRRGPTWLRWGGTFWLVCTLTATLGLGAHYGLDLVAGAAFCLTIESVLRDPGRGWDRARIRVVAMGIATFAAVLLCVRYLAMPMATHPVPFGIAVLGMLTALCVVFYRTWFAPQPPVVVAREAELEHR
ncbi:phosphatase PAP2 family protein [Nocardia cyriacigeorgica]|uniref:phosphatase PAP2 family protein n=1 Tax=Nocardia cyriacigeorgica TaxID=135487 RepID=UPI002491BD4C|nr:phosphatase PAP2 family protein [Nocardia cyriacigeorgica]BDU06223.1 inositol phosphorylceramide synthase [Nocardia cyriacigeorgica]